eukprot:1191802-Prorocentrum_minimum.AAC.2
MGTITNRSPLQTKPRSRWPKRPSTSIQQSTVDTSVPFSARHFEYSIDYSTYIPCRQAVIGRPTVDSGACCKQYTLLAVVVSTVVCIVCIFAAPQVRPSYTLFLHFEVSPPLGMFRERRGAVPPLRRETVSATECECAQAHSR